MDDAVHPAGPGEAPPTEHEDGDNAPGPAEAIVAPDPELPSEDEPISRTARFAWVAVIVLLVGVIALVVYALTGTPATQAAVRRTPAPAALVDSLGHVPQSVFDSVGVDAPDTPLVAPTLLAGQPNLQADGHPEVLYVGSEFCPFCAAQRWPLIVALSRFGRFTGLDNMQSAPESVFPGIQTFSFVGSTYTSPYLTFEPVELYSTQTTPQGTFARIANLNPAQAAVVARYGAATGTRVGTGDLPFVDIADRMVATTSGYSPAVLERQSQATIASDIDHGTGQVGQAIVASANYLTAGLCTATGQRPASVCTSKGVRAAATALGSA
jgi:Domain of unknown function (DUF929)